jgi:hypothetical protein
MCLFLLAEGRVFASGRLAAFHCSSSARLWRIGCSPGLAGAIKDTNIISLHALCRGLPGMPDQNHILGGKQLRRDASGNESGSQRQRN